MTKLLNSYSSMDCESLKKYAFNTHDNCYLNPGYKSKGFCQIVNNNKLTLLKTFNPFENFNDFFNELSFKQV